MRRTHGGSCKKFRFCGSEFMVRLDVLHFDKLLDREWAMSTREEDDLCEELNW